MIWDFINAIINTNPDEREGLREELLRRSENEGEHMKKFINKAFDYVKGLDQDHMGGDANAEDDQKETG